MNGKILRKVKRKKVFNKQEGSPMRKKNKSFEKRKLIEIRIEGCRHQKRH